MFTGTAPSKLGVGLDFLASGNRAATFALLRSVRGLPDTAKFYGTFDHGVRHLEYCLSRFARHPPAHDGWVARRTATRRGCSSSGPSTPSSSRARSQPSARSLATSSDTCGCRARGRRRDAKESSTRFITVRATTTRASDHAPPSHHDHHPRGAGQNEGRVARAAAPTPRGRRGRSAEPHRRQSVTASASGPPPAPRPEPSRRAPFERAWRSSCLTTSSEHQPARASSPCGCCTYE